MRDTGEDHHARRSARFQEVQQELGEQEMSQVIDPELGLETVCGLLKRHGHDAGVIHKPVESVMFLFEFRSEVANGIKAPEVKLHHLNRTAELTESLGDFLPGLLASAAHNDKSALPRQLGSRGQPDTGVGTGDDVYLATEIFLKQGWIAPQGWIHCFSPSKINNRL
jgi:hypothetical protein